MHTVKALLLIAMVTLAPCCVHAQNIEGQVVASQFGEFQVPNNGNGFSFPAEACQVSAGGRNFEAFSTGAPVKIVDTDPSLVEVVTPIAVFLNGACSVSLPAAYSHTSFYLTSGTGGLQEALLSGRTRAGGTNTIILNAEWYQLVAPGNPATVIATVTGGSGFGLVDVTTTPYSYYSWNGSQFVATAVAGGSPPTGPAGGALGGTYPNPNLATAALPNGMKATTQAVGDASNKVATDAFVLANGVSPASLGTISVMDPAYGGHCNWNGTTGTDDSPALQAASTAASNSYAATGIPETIVVPYGCTDGTSAGHTTITVGSGVHWQGPGSVFVPAQSANEIFHMASTDDDSFVGITINVVSNLSACGPAQNNSACAAIRYDSATPGTGVTHHKVYVENNHILNSGWGIFIAPQAGTDLLENVHITGNTVTQSTAPIVAYQYADGIHLGGAVSAAEITGNIVNGRGDAGIAVSSEVSTVLRQCHDVTITGNDLYEDHVGIDVSGCSNVNVTGNRVYADVSTSTSNPAFRSIYYNALPQEINVSGNTFHNYQSAVGVPANSAQFDCLGDCGSGGTATILNSKFSGNKLLTFYGRGSQLDVSGNTFESAGSIDIDWDSTNGYGSYNVTVGANSWLNSGTITLANRTDVYAGGVLYPQVVAGSPLTIPFESLTLAPVPNGTVGTTQSPGDNSTKLATDAFVLANGGGAPSGSAGGALSGTYPNPGVNQNSVVVPNPSNTQFVVQPAGTFLGVTNLNQQFYVSGYPYGCTTNEGTMTTQLSCAWFSVYDYAVANTAMVTLNIGYGYYPLERSLYEPTQSFTGISLEGPLSGVQGTVIYATATMADAMIYKNQTAAGGTLPFLSFSNFHLGGNDEVQGCMRIWGAQEPVFRNLNCTNIPNGAPFLYQIGQPSNYGQGWTFGAVYDNVFGGNSPGNPSTKAVVTPTVVSGNITGYVVSNGGSGYPTPGVETVNYVVLVGNKSGTSDQPCTAMPTGLTATVSGGVVTAVSGTGGTGCSGTITAEIMPLTNIAVGCDVWSTDSRIDDLSCGSTIIGDYIHGGNTTSRHAHPTGTVIGIKSGGNNVFKDTELDTISKWGFDFQGGSGTEDEVDGTNSFGDYPAANVYHIASASTVQFGAQGNLCAGSTPTDYHEFLFPSGTFEVQGSLPNNSSVGPNDDICGNLGAIFPLLTVNTLHVSNALTLPSGSTATTQSGGDNTTNLATDAFVHAAVASLAPLANPAFTGTPTVPTPSPGTNSAQAASTAFVAAATANEATTNSANNYTVGQVGPAFWPQTKSAGPYSTLFDDFYSGANNAPNPIGAATGDTCVVNTTYTDNNHPGNLLLTSGTGGTGTGITCGYQGESASIFNAATSPGWTWETAVYVPVLPATTAGSFQAGLTHTPNANPWTSGINFYLSSANSVANDWYCAYSSTYTDAAVVAVVGWQRLTIVNDGTNVHWYVNGTQVCGTGVAIASMPTTTQYPASWSATALGTTSVTMAVDYVDFQRAVVR